MTHLNDGSILIPTNQPIPKDIPGYKPTKSNPRHWIPEPDPCKHRQKQVRSMPCGKFKILYHCALKCKQTTMAECVECEEGEE